MFEMEIAINGLARVDLALEAAMRAAEDGDLSRTDYALDLIKLALDCSRTELANALHDMSNAKTA